jgi:single-strand DNA-binding protein
MQDTNIAVFTAHLTRDPELRALPSGMSVCNLRVAIGRRQRRGEDGGAAFVDVETWGTTAENCARFLAKGRHISVTSRIEHREWEHEGQNYQRVYFVAEQVLFLGGAPESSASSDDAEPDSDGAQEPQTEPAAAAA